MAPCVLERLSASFACILSNFAPPGDERTRESPLPSTQEINSKTGNRIRIARSIRHGRVGTCRPDRNIEITEEELGAIALESHAHYEVDEFVLRNEIDELYNIRPYYIAPMARSDRTPLS
jgi:non-homologous end joining protein Ku